MKPHLITLALSLLLFKMNSSGNSNMTIKEQLKCVNLYWTFHPLQDNILDSKSTFSSDRELIQLHLKFVEKTLRAKSTVNLTEDQKTQRSKLLDILHLYCQNGSFPKNTNHSERTPYFIDKFGTSCAVGYLIINSGYEALAQQISQENNNGYIFDLVTKYPKILGWAKAHGFSIDELAWIQPCYGAPVDTAGLRQPTCHNARNGYFSPDVSQLQIPLTKTFYRSVNGNWVVYMDMCGSFAFYYLEAGKYKWDVKDGMNTMHTYSVELIAPPPATITTIESGNFNACNGVITVSVQGGVLPFNYFWTSKPSETTAVLSSVCEELVNLTFYEGGSYCPQFFQIETRPVGLQEYSTNNFYISPSPVGDILNLKFDKPFSTGFISAKVFDIYGRLVLEENLQSEELNINLSQIPKGLYILQIGNLKSQRIVKE